ARTPDAVYRVVLSAAHGARSLVLSLKASGLPGGPDDAWWAIDNAVVQTVDDPGALDRAVDAARVAVARLEMGLGGLAPVAPEPVRAATHLLAPTLGHAGALEVAAALAPLGASRDGGTFLPSAVSGLPPTDLHIESPTLLTAAFAREHPAPALPSIAVVPFRAEQPVVRRVESLAYQSRFTSGVGPEWDAPSHGVAPRGERFVGPFGDGAATLRLSDLPEHDQLVIDADLYTIGDWPGNGPTPSRLTVTLDGKALMADTFAVEDGLLKRTQTYPSDGGRKRRIPAADAAAIDALGYPPVGDAAKGAAGDVTYHLRFVVPHTAGAGALRFAAQGLTAGAASWGLDNVTVVASGRRAMRFADATGMEPDDNADDGVAARDRPSHRLAHLE
ncbi:MAG: hypothetical protein K2X91_16550, partial [Thermoleophilia bacterium]|nr:hypothetical protein [Mycobacteriaceae bacterium]MBY0398059.1 hypothetical protein [Thermoleophilia bacterium]